MEYIVNKLEKNLTSARLILRVPEVSDLHDFHRCFEDQDAMKYYIDGISSKTLANADSKGTGPEGRIFVGRRVCYPVPSFIQWLRRNARG